MNIKKIASNTLQFIINRLIEIIGVCISLIGALLLIALFSYSPSDPNFIFPENTEIQNILGFQGSYISDLFFQSIGAISYLISITLMVTGINIFNRKDLFLIIENIFFSIFYCIFGSLFLIFFTRIHLNYILMEMVGLLGNTLVKPFLEIF
jgi:S-DNA-T family DNA segregation ATPase FtsK/SpoIIIE